MDLARFELSLDSDAPPAGLGVALRGLWWARRGRWDLAHELVQDDAGTDAAWVHAWLHREEGDLPNADWWYRRAGQERPDRDLGDEWRSIVVALLAGSAD